MTAEPQERDVETSDESEWCLFRILQCGDSVCSIYSILDAVHQEEAQLVRAHEYLQTHTGDAQAARDYSGQ